MFKNTMIRSVIAGFLFIPCLSYGDNVVSSKGVDAYTTGDSVVINPQSAQSLPAESRHVLIGTIPGVPKIFLPDIGIAGDFAYERHNLPKTDTRHVSEQPRIRDGQVVFFEPIDPYTNAQFTIDLPDGNNATIEEAWIYFNKLPGNTSVRVGRFLPRFGLLDLLNTFQLPMVDRPRAIGNYLSQDGIISTGLEFNTYIPNPWDWNLKLNLNAVRGDALQGAGDGTDLAYLGTLDYSQDIFRSGSLQTGVSIGQAPSPFGRSEVLEEPYLQIQFAPTQRRIFTWSTEALFAERQGLGPENNKAGIYSFFDYEFNLRYHVGFLTDLADQQVAPYGKTLGLGPNATWFVSDNTRMRMQYTHITPLGGQRPEEKVTFQATFSIGNLKQLN